jgi:hypothetical protein
MDFTFENTLYTCVADEKGDRVAVHKDGYYFRDISWNDINSIKADGLQIVYPDKFVEAFVKQLHSKEEQQ